MSAFDNIIGYESIKTQLRQICDMIHRPAPYLALGARMPKGLLFHGAPGLGKSLMASALMAESGLPGYLVRRDKTQDDFVKFLETTFDTAAKNAPSMLLLDDMDRYAESDWDHSEYTAVQACIDKVQNKEVFIIATVNNMDSLPDALLRSGRFDRKIELQHPNAADAQEIIRHYLEGKPVSPDICLPDLAQMLTHRSCAELESALNEAAICAAYEGSPVITMAHLVRAVLSAVLQVSPDISSVAKEERLMTAVHEAGHAALLELRVPGSTAMVTLYREEPDRCFGFAVRNRPLDQHTHIMMCLAGKAAQELEYGRCATGCGSDISRAVSLLRRNMGELGSYGMLGVSVGREVSPSTRAEQEVILRAELERYLFETKALLAANRELVQKLSHALLEKQTLLHSDVQAICSGCDIVPAAA